MNCVSRKINVVMPGWLISTRWFPTKVGGLASSRIYRKVRFLNHEEIYLNDMNAGLIFVHRVKNHVSLSIIFVICQFEFIEGNYLAHPILARGRGFGMNVNSWWDWIVCSSRYHPLRTILLLIDSFLNSTFDEW